MRKTTAPSNYSTTKSLSPKSRLWWGTVSFSFSFSLVFGTLGLLTSNTKEIQTFLKENWKKAYVEILSYQAQANENSSPSIKNTVPTPHMALHQSPLASYEVLPEFSSLAPFEKLQFMKRTEALKDPLDRISPEFHVPERLQARTQFWFDIYTKHDSYTHVIHHTRYPWIIYKVIDTRDMVENGKGPRWLRKDRANKHVKAERLKIEKALKRLAHRRSYKKLNSFEQDLYKTLNSLQGKRKTVFRMAYQNVRSQLGQKDYFVKGLKNSSRYLPYMEEEFSRLGVPTELTRIPFVESSFNEKAISKVGASGIWQIMPRTGKAFVRVDKTIDERNSPLKATVVAAKIFRNYHRSLKSWPLTITSYNHGIGNIKKAIRAARSRDLPTIIARYHRGDFKFASSNFYTCFLAALHAEKYHDAIFPEIEKERLLERKVYTLTSSISLNTLKKTLNLTTEDIVAYNQDLISAGKKNIVLRRGYVLHLPPGHEEKLLQKIGLIDKKQEKRASQDIKKKRSA